MLRPEFGLGLRCRSQFVFILNIFYYFVKHSLLIFYIDFHFWFDLVQHRGIILLTRIFIICPRSEHFLIRSQPSIMSGRNNFNRPLNRHILVLKSRGPPILYRDWLVNFWQSDSRLHVGVLSCARRRCNWSFRDRAWQRERNLIRPRPPLLRERIQVYQLPRFLVHPHILKTRQSIPQQIPLLRQIVPIKILIRPLKLNSSHWCQMTLSM